MAAPARAPAPAPLAGRALRTVALRMRTLVLAACCCCLSVYADNFRLETTMTAIGPAALAFHRHHERAVNASDESTGAAGCLFEGRWFVPGAVVTSRASCLRCACAGGALSCARRACAPLPEPPPPKCHVLHRRGACCPELHCPDGVRSMEYGSGGSARMEDESAAAHTSRGKACVAGGAVFAAGSAMAASAACEQCFCLGGKRRCVRPSCLPVPSRCRPRPAPGLCCPQRYYCDPPASTLPPMLTDQKHSTHDCEVGGRWVAEGERVTSTENCTSCFCLRGAVRCQPLACARALLGCEPLLRPGDCCPHKYHCERDPLPPHLPAISDNALTPVQFDDRSFSSKHHESTAVEKRHESTVARISSATNGSEAKPDSSSIKAMADKSTAATTKVKRKTSDPPPTTVSENKTQATTEVSTIASTSVKTTGGVTSGDVGSGGKTSSSTMKSDVTSTTALPDGSVTVVVNGTVNCSTELTSSSSDASPAPSRSVVPTADIITDGPLNGFGDSFTINVTSSLSHSTNEPNLPVDLPQDISDLPESFNASAKNKDAEYEDDDYEYMEPTLPPSLPNLKIIPFVAADAVVDEDAPKPFPSNDREDKFPVYYPAPALAVPTVQALLAETTASVVEAKDVPVANRREDTNLPTQFPVYVDKRVALEEKTTAGVRPGGEGTSQREPVTTSVPAKASTFNVETPAVNLFSPPAETEGGFVPKGPGLIDEYYAVYPSTRPPAQLLTTSLQIDVAKGGECSLSDGRRVAGGARVALACSWCACEWGELQCAPRTCSKPPKGCRRRPPPSAGGDQCCGDLVCDEGNTTKTSTTTPRPTTSPATPAPLPSDVIPFDPPPDRAVPSTTPRSTTAASTSPRDEVTKKPTTPATVTTNTTRIATTTVKPNVNEGKNATSASKLKDVTTTPKSSTTTATPSTTPKLLSTTILATTEKPQEANETSQSQEYEDEEEEDEDEGFSLGSVLKLLLSDSYDSTTAPPKRRPSSPAFTPLTTTTTPAPSIPTTQKRLPPSVAQFIPMPQYPYLPPKKLYTPNAVNRIDHLVLGEATAIRKTTPRASTTPRPPTTPFRPMTTMKHVPRPTTRRTTPAPTTVDTYTTHRLTNVHSTNVHSAIVHSTILPMSGSPITRPSASKLPNARPTIATANGQTNGFSVNRLPSGTTSGVPTSAPPKPAGGSLTNSLPGSGSSVNSFTGNSLPVGGSSANSLPSSGGGLLKLAGCNIYGRMYRVGRIIVELSTPCQECRCTELGVQCTKLSC